MDSPIFSLAIAVAAAVLVYPLFRLFRVGRRPADYPPGPPTLPVLGNIHQIPSYRPHLQFQKWADEYGPIYSLILGTKTYIVLSSPTAVKDLLDKRSSIYSSRPDFYLGQDVASGGYRFVIMKYGPFWRLIHKMMHNSLNIKTAVAYIPYQDLENKHMLLGLLDQPNNFVSHLRRYANSLTTQMVFGFRTLSTEDPRLLQFFKGFEKWGELVGSASAQLLDLYPIFRILPAFLNSEYRHAKQLHQEELALYTGHWLDTKDKIKQGTCHPCFGIDVALAQKKEGFSDEQAAYITGSLLEGGSDTTSGTLVGFIQAMMMWPEVQKRAQEEVDRVVGSDRMPQMEDALDLPYIRACVKESIRWMPTVIMGVPHGLLQDDYYMGYKLPAGAAVINNVWAINMDPKRNPNPRTFDPLRFIDDTRTEYESATSGDENQRQNWIFGAGRRLCKGMHIAERSLFLAASRILWGFDIQKALDENGQPISPDVDDLVGGITVQPNDFAVRIIPRSKEKADMIRKEWQFCEDTILDPVTKQWKRVPDGMKFSTYVPEKEDA